MTRIDPPPSERWRTSVHELVLLFREALIALTPVLDGAHIVWRDGQGYDQWMHITWTLFGQIVVDAIEYGLSEGAEKLDIPNYNQGFHDYARQSFIVVETDEHHPASVILFTKFSDDDEGRFGDVQCSRRSPDGSSDEVRLPVERCHFVLMRRLPDGTLERVTDLEIVD
jgi:hypothetical protein